MIDWQHARATVVIAVATALVSALILVSGFLPHAAVGAGLIPLRFDPAAPGAAGFPVPAWLTPLSATLVHGGWAHLVLNLVMLVYCGGQVERAVGARGVVILYLVGAYAAGAAQWAAGPASVTPMIGASGAISAVVAAYALLFGQRQARGFGPIPARIVHVAWLAAAWIGIQLLIGLAGMMGGAIAIFAHIGGFLAGLALARPLLLWRWRGA